MGTVTIRNVNDIYPIVGNGKFQLIVVAVFCLAIIPANIQQFTIYFIAFNPDWKYSNGSMMSNFTGSISSSSTNYGSRCNIARSDWIYVEPKEFSIVTEVNFVLICNI